MNRYMIKLTSNLAGSTTLNYLQRFFLLTNFDSFVKKNVSKSVVVVGKFQTKILIFPSFEYKRGHFFKTNYKPKIYFFYDSKI